jgi:hypothetical protein
MGKSCAAIRTWGGSCNALGRLLNAGTDHVVQQEHKSSCNVVANVKGRAECLDQGIKLAAAHSRCPQVCFVRVTAVCRVEPLTPATIPFRTEEWRLRWNTDYLQYSSRASAKRKFDQV